MDIQSSGSAGDDSRKNEMMEAESPNEREDLFDKFLNLNISNIQEQQYFYQEVKTDRRHNKRNHFKKILNSSSSNERLIPSSPLKGSSRQNSERHRNYFQTQNSMDQESFRKNFKKRQEESFSVSNTIKDSSSSFSERSDSKSIKNILPPDFQEEAMDAEEEKFGCNCKRSKCLKLYCQCFQRQLFCNENCNCHDCGNNLQNSEKHQKAVIQALGRNAHGFQQQKRGQIKQTNQRQGFSLGVQIKEVKKGCKCRKTHCIKKYCECYQNNVFCGIFCRCQECFNKDFYQKKY